MSISPLHIPYSPRFLMCGRSRKLSKHNDKPSKICKNGSNSDQFFMDILWRETQQLMERSEQLVRLITHVCSQKLSGVFRTESCPRQIYECCSSVAPRACGEESGGRRRAADPSCRGSPSDHVDLRRADEEGEGGSWRGGFSSSSPPCSCSPSSSNLKKETHFSCWAAPEEWRCGCSAPADPLSGFGGAGGMGEAGPPSPPPPPPPLVSKQKHPPSSPSWTKPSIRPSVATSILAFLLLVASIATSAESCSSRSTPKPRPASAPTLRPNVTFQTYACPPTYAAWFCLNGATCFTVKIQDAILYNCECAEGYMGPRCEFKDLDGSYSPTRGRVLLETASIAGGACVAIVLVFCVLFALYVLVHKDREKRRSHENPYDDKRPLSGHNGSNYICTITPVHLGHSLKQGCFLKTKVPLPASGTAELSPASKDLYLISGIGPTRLLCACEEEHHRVASPSPSLCGLAVTQSPQPGLAGPAHVPTKYV